MAVRQTSCRFCALDIENESPYKACRWMDRGGNKHCPDWAGGKCHAPFRHGKDDAIQMKAIQKFRNPMSISLSQIDAALRKAGKTVKVTLTGAGAAAVKKALSMTPGGRRKARSEAAIRRVMGNPSQAFDAGVRAGKGGNWSRLPSMADVAMYGIDKSNYSEFKHGFQSGKKLKRKR